MAIVWSYTAATNTAVVTGGTSGTPATFATFVTADLAGTFNLVSRTGIAAVDGSPVAVTNALRPTDAWVMGGNGAGQSLGIVVTAWTNMTAATISIVGTDGVGAAQSETIALTGNATYYTTKLYHTITSTQVTVWTGTGSFAYTLTQGKWGVIWNQGNGCYTINCYLWIGDASTTTYMKTTRENIIFTPKYFSVFANATFQIGNLQGSWGYDGSQVAVTPESGAPAYGNLIFGGSLLIYASLIRHLGTGGGAYLANGIVTIKNSIFLADYYDDSNFNRGFLFGYYGQSMTLDLQSVYCADLYAQLNVTPAAFNNVHLHYLNIGLVTNTMSLTAIGLQLTSLGGYDIDVPAVRNGAAITLQDPVASINTVLIEAGATTAVYESYSCNIYIADKDGNNLSGVTVACVDKNSTPVFSVTTASDGTIAQQVIIHKQWLGTTPTITNYSPHKFTISKVGYQTLVIPNITVNAPIVWHLELQQAGFFPRSMSEV